MRMRTATGLVLCVLMVMVTDASAQLTAAKDGPIVYGHHHLNTTNVDAQKKFLSRPWEESRSRSGRTISRS